MKREGEQVVIRRTFTGDAGRAARALAKLIAERQGEPAPGPGEGREAGHGDNAAA